MKDILQEIIAVKRQEVAVARTRVSMDEVIRLAKSADPVRSFHKALTSGRQPRIIAECKRKSPSRGVMVQSYDPVRLAKAYETGGAAAISILTDEQYFGGALDHLSLVRPETSIPLLRKDFIIDPYQIFQARAAGADSFLLLAGVLDKVELKEFLQIGRSLEMEALVESHTAAELDLALAAGGVILGINNRDLKDFSINLDHARSLYRHGQSKSPDIVMVCESGIKSRMDVENMMGVGYNVFLIGESLATHPDPEAGLKGLLSR